MRNLLKIEVLGLGVQFTGTGGKAVAKSMQKGLHSFAKRAERRLDPKKK